MYLFDQFWYLKYYEENLGPDLSYLFQTVPKHRTVLSDPYKMLNVLAYHIWLGQRQNLSQKSYLPRIVIDGYRCL